MDIWNSIFVQNLNVQNVSDVGQAHLEKVNHSGVWMPQPSSRIGNILALTEFSHFLGLTLYKIPESVSCNADLGRSGMGKVKKYESFGRKV